MVDSSFSGARAASVVLLEAALGLSVVSVVGCAGDNPPPHGGAARGGQAGASASGGRAGDRTGGAGLGGETAEGGSSGERGGDGGLAGGGEAGATEPSGGTAGTTGGSGAAAGTSGGGGTSGKAGSAGTSGTGGMGGTGVDPCAFVSCSGHGVCTSSGGSATCTCDPGYALDGDDAGACVDIDECALDNGGCDALTACINVPGTHGCGACPAGYTGDGVEGCVPVECEGAPVSGCACVKVAPDGDDALGAMSGGVSPFLTVQAAIDFAAAHPAHARKVCLAAGPSCGSSSPFAPPDGGTFTMRDGVSVYGRYEATTFTRCDDSVTSLSGALAFGSDIASTTTLDGIRVDGPLTAQGAHGARIEEASLSSVEASASSLIIVNSSMATVDWDDSPGSRIEGSSTESARVAGDVSGIVLASNSISGGLSIEDCSGEISVVHDTITVSVPSGPEGSKAVALHVDGTCHAVIESSTIASSSGDGIDGVALDCAAPCAILDNVVTTSKWTNNFDYHQWDPYPNRGQAMALACSGCSEVRRNTITVAVPQSPFYNVPGNYTVTAAAIGAGTFVARNFVSAGCADNAVGMIVGASRVENNVIGAGCGNSFVGPFPRSYPIHSFGLTAGSNADVHSNSLVSASEGSGPNPLNPGLNIAGTGVIARNNVIAGRPYAANAAASVMENNVLDGGIFNLSGDPFGDGTGNVSGHCFSDASGHLPFTSPCVNAGTVAGAPADDFDGEARDAQPDVGPDEWSAAHDPCPGIICSRHGACIPLSQVCFCDAGYLPALGDPTSCVPDPCVQTPCDPLTTCTRDGEGRTCSACPSGYTGTGESGCEDLDECAANNGGCDPLTECTNTAGSRSCGPCPPSYAGNGETGCIYTTTCDPNPCDHEGTCIPGVTDFTCECPLGIMGAECEHAFTQLSLGAPYFCGVRDDAALLCNVNQSAVPSGTFLAVSSGFNYGCAIRTDGTLACFGIDIGGQASPPSGTFTAVDTGNGTNGTYTCAIRSDGTLACFGMGGEGPVPPPSGTFTAVSTGLYVACAISTSGSIVCFGFDNPYDLLNPPSGSFDQISLSDTFGCGVRGDKTIACWGSNLEGEATPPSGTFDSLKCAMRSCCAIRTDGSLACWGKPIAGTPPLGTFREVVLGRNHDVVDLQGCATGENDIVQCWGDHLVLPPTGGT